MIKSILLYLQTPHVGLIEPENEKEVLGYSYAICGVSFAAILALACLPDVSCYLRWATWCFSVSLPASLTFSLFFRQVLIGGWSTRLSRAISLALGSLVYLSVWVAAALLCLHISGIAAAIFLPLSVIGVGFGKFFARIHGTMSDRLSGHYGQEIQGPLPPLDPRE